MKKILALIMAAAMLALLAACTTTPVDTTAGTSSASTEPTGATAVTTTASETGATTATATSSGGETPVVEIVKNDPVKEKFGKYVSVIYNPAYCKVTASVEAGVGSKETVTLSIEMNDGFIFDGWTVPTQLSSGAYAETIVNGAKPVETKTTYSLTVSEETNIFANYSFKVIYNANGGTAQGGGDTYEQKFSAVWYKCPVSLPEKGYFIREGYTLSEYNTKPDGSGTAVSLGSRVFTDDKGVTTLYCIWEKQSPEADFEYTGSGLTATITSYKGTDETVVIPDTLGGAKVITVGAGAFKGTTAKKVILSKNVRNVNDKAFAGSDIDSLVIFDSLTFITDNAFDPGQLKHLRINASLGMFKNWMQTQSTTKLDRLVYAAGKGIKKLVMYGGSGSLYGFECKQIDEALNGKYCVINVGSNANATAAFFFDWFEELVTEDDIILWVPELGSYMLGDTRFTDRLWGVISGHYDAFRNVDISEFSNVLTTYTSYAGQHVTACDFVPDSYSQTKEPNAYGEYGSYDVYGDLISLRAHEDGSKDYNFTQYPEFYFYMSDLIARISENGTRIYFAPAAMIKDGDGISDAAYEAYVGKIKNAFPKLIHIVSDYKDLLVDYEYRYNSQWHFTWDGAVVRTKQLVPYIEAQVEKDGK